MQPIKVPTRASHATPPIQPSYAQDRQDSQNDTQGNDQDNAGVAEIPFAETLRKLIPEDSLLMHSIKERKSSAVFIHEGSLKGKGLASVPESNVIEYQQQHNKLLDSTRLCEIISAHRLQSGSSVWIMEDINLEWAQVMLSEFPGTLNQTFLAQHMIRLNSTGVNDLTVQQLRDRLASRAPVHNLTLARIGSVPIVGEVRNLCFHLCYQKLASTGSYELFPVWRLCGGSGNPACRCSRA